MRWLEGGRRGEALGGSGPGRGLHGPYLQGPLQGLAVGGKLVHSVLVVGVPLDERPGGLHLHAQVQSLFLQALQQRKQ